MLGAGQDLDRALRYLRETAPNARVARVVVALAFFYFLRKRIAVEERALGIR